MTSRKPYKVTDKTRRVKKGLMASSLEELILSSLRKLAYPGDKEEVMMVLEEDGTEVDEEEYFQVVLIFFLFLIIIIAVTIIIKIFLLIQRWQKLKKYHNWNFKKSN